MVWPRVPEVGPIDSLEAVAYPQEERGHDVSEAIDRSRRDPFTAKRFSEDL
jgi:hypothetical protein